MLFRRRIVEGYPALTLAIVIGVFWMAFQINRDVKMQADKAGKTLHWSSTEES